MTRRRNRVYQQRERLGNKAVLKTELSNEKGRAPESQTSTRLSIPEIASRLSVGRLTVYAMLEKGIIPGVRVGNRWIVTRSALELWERTCGMQLPEAALMASAHSCSLPTGGGGRIIARDGGANRSA